MSRSRCTWWKPLCGGLQPNCWQTTRYYWSREFFSSFKKKWAATFKLFQSQLAQERHGSLDWTTCSHQTASSSLHWPVLTGTYQPLTLASALLTPAGSRSRHYALTPRRRATSTPAGAASPAPSQHKMAPPPHSASTAPSLASPAATPTRASPSATRRRRGESYSRERTATPRKSCRLHPPPRLFGPRRASALRIGHPPRHS